MVLLQSGFPEGIRVQHSKYPKITPFSFTGEFHVTLRTDEETFLTDTKDGAPGTKREFQMINSLQGVTL